MYGCGTYSIRSVGLASVVNKALTPAEDDSFRRPGQVPELGGAGQHLTEHVERSKTSKDQIRSLTSKVQEQDCLHNPELVLDESDSLQGSNSRQKPHEARQPPQYHRPFRSRSKHNKDPSIIKIRNSRSLSLRGTRTG